MTINEVARTKLTPSNDHLEWLVKGRSLNQLSAMKIRKLMTDDGKKIQSNSTYSAIVDDLLAINFSLWRAVFLSDLTAGSEHIFSDALKFLDELISNNIITYSQDKGSKEWSFLYYMSNARFRLDDLHNSRPDVLNRNDYPELSEPTDKEWWEHHQRALDAAIEKFSRLLSA